MLNHYRKSLPMFERDIEKMLDEQCVDKNNIYYGVIENVGDGYVEPSNGCEISSLYITAYYTPGIKYYLDDNLLFRAKIAMEHTLKRQHDDGTLDLMVTNFHDSTMCGFVMQKVGPAYLLMRKFTKNTKEENELDELYLRFIKNCGEAMTNCGFHTPNHRWVVSSALSFCYNIIKDERYLNHIKKFLAEGIDCDENGEFSERSAGIYNIVCDRSLIIIAMQLNMPEILEHVKRNLYMAIKYFEPDWTINTMNSNRQDFGADPDFDIYYECYTTMALLTQNPEFAWIADYILEKNLGKFAADFDKGFGILPTLFLTDENLEAKMLGIKTQKPLFEYDEYFINSGIVRKRIGDTTLTLVKDRPNFAKLQYKDKKMQMRFAGSFFGEPHAHFIAQTIEPDKNNTSYRLTYLTHCGYRRPLDSDDTQKITDWYKFDHSKRGEICVQEFHVVFEFVFKHDGLEITLEADGCDNIPLKLELMFNAGGVYNTPDTEIITREGDYIFLKKGSASYTFKDKKRFIIDGGFNSHRYAKNMRGSIPGDNKACSIVMTGFTPIKKTLRIRWGGINLV